MTENRIVSEQQSGGEPDRPLSALKVCICTPDYMYLVRNGGIGTSFQHTVSVIAPLGADVTVLYANLTPGMNEEDRERAVALVEQDGAKLEYLFPEAASEILSSIFPGDIFTATSYIAYQWLKVRNFDVVIFADWRGVAYYCVHAKRQGLAFAGTQLWIQAHSTALWHELNNQHHNFDETSIRVYHFERKSIELCDRVLGATQYLIDWMLEHGFILPSATSVYPLIINDRLLSRSFPPTQSRLVGCSSTEEIVFFGRLEKRKGLLIFLQALQRIYKYNPELLGTGRVKVTFLGKIATVDGVSSVTFIERELKGIGIDYSILPSLSSSEAISYLRDKRALAVIPSLTDNSPLTVHECINAGIPFIAARTGGIPELINPEDHRVALVEPTGPAIASRIVEICSQGQEPIRAAVDQKKNIARWVELLRDVKRQQPSQISLPDESPLVSVCLVHYERPDLLRKTLEGLRLQTYKNFEVILVDNDSRSEKAVRFLGEICQLYPELNIRIERLPDLYAGAARNKALALANGEFVVFMDDDNYAHSKQIEVFVRAITSSAYDALSCALVVFDANDDPADLKRFIHLFIPAGSGISLNLFANAYGDANGIYRKRALIAVGGLTEERLSWEDYELFSKLEQSGAKVGVIPEPLVYLRASVGSVSRRGSMLSNYYRALRPALKKFPWATFGDALLVALSPRLQAANSYRFEKDDVLDDKRILYNSESPIVVARLLVERAAIAEGLPGGIYQLSRLVAARGSLDKFRRDLLFSRVSASFSSLSFDNAAGDPDSLLAQECIEIFKKRSFAVVGEFVAANSLSAPDPDADFMSGLLSLIDGRPMDALSVWSSMLRDAEFVYLKSNPDLKRGVELKHLRSGVQHFLLYGYNEFRPFSYHIPLRGPLASDCRLCPADYLDRTQRIKVANTAEGVGEVESLLIDIISGGSVVAACDFARVLLSEGDARYLSDYSDVAHAIDEGRIVDVYAHWREFGVHESDRVHLVHRIDGKRIEQALFDRILGPRVVHESAALDFQRSEVKNWIGQIGSNL